MLARRWSDNDRHLGPFTYARDKRYRSLAIVLRSSDDEDYGCTLRFSGFGHTLIVALPPVLRPWRTWVDTSRYDWATAAGYWDIYPRQYGFSASEGFLQVFHGAQTHDSSTTKTWAKFLSWTQWRFVRHSMYDTTGAHFWTEPQRVKGEPYDHEARWKASETCPSVTFAFKDYDGEDLTAKTKIEEREWLKGEGWFKWLSWFSKPRVSRSLDIQFSGETGNRKGSWKGGTIGHSIDMEPGELHEAAFRRYCAEHHMTFIGVVESAQ
jgi:hypothetical protein